MTYRSIAIFVIFQAMILIRSGYADSIPTAEQRQLLSKIPVHGTASGGSIVVEEINFKGTQTSFAFVSLTAMPAQPAPVPGCQMAPATKDNTTPAWLDVGATMYISSLNTNFVLNRMLSAAGITYLGLGDRDKPIDVNTSYDIRFNGDGWIPAQAWQQSLGMPGLVDTSPSLVGGVTFRRGQDYTMTWHPSGGENFEIDFIAGNKLVATCVAVEAAGTLTMPASFLGGLPNFGSVDAIEESARTRTLLEHDVSLVGASVVLGDYILE